MPRQSERKRLIEDLSTNVTELVKAGLLFDADEVREMVVDEYVLALEAVESKCYLNRPKKVSKESKGDQRGQSLGTK